ncbi:MAG: DEAD/DEAH box helicase [Anaerolineae bacterium]|nr:DEAD/DEAH box helicase [Anaerolineae bacterium]
MSPTLLPDRVVWNFDGAAEEWLAVLPVSAASAIGNALEAEVAIVDGASLSVPALEIARWSEGAACALGLPPNNPLSFDVRLTGSIGQPGASIAIRWLKPGKSIPEREAARDGLWLDLKGKRYRIPSPVFEAISLIDQFNHATGSSLEEQFRVWARIREILGERNAQSLTDGFLRSFRVVTASAFTFGISTDSAGEVQVDPVLLTVKRAEEGDRDEHVRALVEADEALFPQRLDQLHEGALAFPISQGTYVVVDEPLRQALGAVRKIRRASPEERKRAAMFPEAVVRETLGLDEAEPTVFIETERFAERVLDIGDWAPPVLPWIKIAPQDWGAPASCGVRIDGVDVPLDGQQLADAVVQMRSAIAAGKREAPVGGKTVPATAANLAALEKLQRAVEQREAGERGSGEDIEASDKVLIIETNFDETTYSRVSVGRRLGTPGLPGGLKTSPKPHQETGIRWLQRHWIEGSPGALLCDDMGLGKTFQALAFCQWLREAMEAGTIERKPLLLVAPVGLLRNWEREIEEHLAAPGLGDIVRAYGEHLRGLRRGRHVDGTASLDTARLARGDVVLANYEAVSDYQLSFGAVPFAAIVLDEAQKVKSPKARMTHAVKAMNADFVLAMTGTPVENRLADLWCIADTAQPGALSDLKAFSSRYEVEGADVAALRGQIWQEEGDAESAAPRLLLRRLKTDKLEGLPRKHEHVIKETMPNRQAEAYGRALALQEISGPEGTLGMIHALRRVSLHPLLVEGGVMAGDLRVEDSARLKATIDVLDRVAESGEKALVFLESLDLQDTEQLPMLLKRRYSLERLPMVINGQVGTEARQARVEAFQRDTGFDVMLLSPKAGGVGLTLTAANHVIHLSRWWNPAVEDQCSDRVYRIGQKKLVHIYYPLAIHPEAGERSFDLQLQMLMDRKRRLAQDLLAAPAFSKQDYQDLMAGTGLSSR